MREDVGRLAVGQAGVLVEVNDQSLGLGTDLTGGGSGGVDGSNPASCLTLCGSVISGGAGGSGAGGNAGVPGDFGVLCSKLDGAVCTA